MWENLSFIKLSLFSILFITFTPAQNFNIEDYIEFLSQHQDISTEELLSMHPAGNYLSKWDSKNNEGISVSSGIYIYKIEVEHRQASGKMMLIK
jgi:hypothetical protein